MASTQKAVGTIRMLKDLLKQRGYTVADSFSTVDTDGNPAPVLQVGPGTAGTASAFIKCKPIAAWGKDVLGLSQNVFTPHILQVVIEGISGAGAQPLPYANLLDVLGEVLARGMATELYVRANASAAVETDIVAGNLKNTFQPHLQYPTMMNQ